MVTHLTLAYISQQVQFKDGGFVDGWKCQEYYSDPEGFGAGVYVNDKSNEMVIAFRGADTGNAESIEAFIKSLKLNLQFIFGKTPKLHINAHDFVNKVRSSRTVYDRLIGILTTRTDNQLYLTGYGTGASIATLVGLKFNIAHKKRYRVVVFESIGIDDSISEDDLIKNKMHIDEFFLTYLADPSLLNTRYKQIGKVRRIHVKPYTPKTISHGEYYIAHIIDCLINDAFRILLFLILLNLVISRVLGRGSIPEVLSATTNGLTAELQKRNYISSPDTTDSFNTLWPLFKAIAYTLFSKIFTKAITATVKQRSIDTMIKQLTIGHGEAAEYSEIVQWPRTKQYAKAHLKYITQWLHPYRHPSLLSIKMPIELHEKKIQEMDGYQEQSVVKRY